MPVRTVGIGAIFIDDIVLPDGTTYMGQLGGGVVHALMGATLWDERPGIVALAGHDLLPDIRARLEAHFDTQGLHLLDIPQIRAWQIFETDGTRRELYRVEITAPFTGGAQPQHLPPAYRNAQGYYLLQGFTGIQRWCQYVDGVVVWEPLQQAMQPGTRDQLRACLASQKITAISPNLSEAQAVYGHHPPGTLVEMLLSDGAPVVALRMGASGSIIASQHQQFHVPALAVPTIVDQTGAGNTYCGALLAGLVQVKPLHEIAAMGTVAASFCVEQIGVIDLSAVDRRERDKRHQHVIDNVR